MSRLYPGHDRRMRRFRTASIVMTLALVAEFVVALWPRNSPISDGLPWPLTLLGMGGLVLVFTGLALTLSALRELNRLGPHNRRCE